MLHLCSVQRKANYMKTLVTLLLLIFSLTSYSQNKNTAVEYSKDETTKITSLKFTTGLITELESINWEDIKSIFETNKPEDKFEISFELDLKESKDKYKSSITVGGETKDLDSLIIISKKLIKSIIKLSKKY